jgi:hypothetical protein
MSFYFSPISIATSYGTYEGFERPLVAQSNLLRQFEETIEIAISKEKASQVKRIFCIITQIFMLDVVQQCYPNFPKGVISLKEPLFYLCLPSANGAGDANTEKINAYIRCFFRDKKLSFLTTYFEVMSFTVELTLLAPTKLGFKGTPIPQTYTPREQQILGIDGQKLRIIQSSPNLGLSSLTCHVFALLKIEEIRLPEYFWNFDFSKNLLPHLKKWKYKVVKELQPNDLILYLERGVLMHTARYIGNGMCESKLGNKSKTSHQHLIADVWGCYGQQMIFFRKG